MKPLDLDTADQDLTHKERRLLGLRGEFTGVAKGATARHGTGRGYERHKRNGTPFCSWCKAWKKANP